MTEAELLNYLCHVDWKTDGTGTPTPIYGCPRINGPTTTVARYNKWYHLMWVSSHNKGFIYPKLGLISMCLDAASAIPPDCEWILFFAPTEREVYYITPTEWVRDSVDYSARIVGQRKGAPLSTFKYVNIDTGIVKSAT